MTAPASRMPTGSCVRYHRRAAGFTYVSLVILVAILGLVAATSVKLGGMLQRSRAELALLDIGAEFSNALQSYADATPAGKPTQPPSLKDLLKDPRFPTVRRHLRKIYIDPVTGKAEWGIVYLANQVGVVAIYSLSQDKPVKIGNFPVRFQAFDSKAHISDWKFTVTARPIASPVVAPAPQNVPLAASPTGAPILPAVKSEEAAVPPTASPTPPPPTDPAAENNAVAPETREPTTE
jgi:type II secretory pathway pseudopilin PulG